MADEKLLNQAEDQELNDLLDSALEDFNKDKKVDKIDDKKEPSEVTTEKDTFESLEEAWTANFIEVAADQFEKNLQNLIKNGTDGELGASFQKMAQTIASVISDEGNTDKDSASTDFETAIARALNDLSATSESLQHEADLPGLLEQASLDDGPGAILPIMQGMLQNLLSKEILYPSLKEVVDKYPEWLEGKKSTLSSSDLHKFTKQLELMQQVCTELEKEKDEDTEEMKKKRFETVTSLMQEVIGYGQLPEELIGDQTMPFPVDIEGNSPQNCRLM